MSFISVRSFQVIICENTLLCCALNSVPIYWLYYPVTTIVFYNHSVALSNSFFGKLIFAALLSNIPVWGLKSRRQHQFFFCLIYKNRSQVSVPFHSSQKRRAHKSSVQKLFDRCLMKNNVGRKQKMRSTHLFACQSQHCLIKLI